jgi:hypothetical protein
LAITIRANLLRLAVNLEGILVFMMIQQAAFPALIMPVVTGGLIMTATLRALLMT